MHRAHSSKPPPKSLAKLELDGLECFEVINFANDMLNEYSLGLLLKQAPQLVELNLTNVEAFNRPALRANIFNAIFGDANIQVNLRKLILLQNPGLDNEIFSKRQLPRLKALQHFEIGGKPNAYLNGITYDGGIAIFACHGLGILPSNSLE